MVTALGTEDTGNTISTFRLDWLQVQQPSLQSNALHGTGRA